jgi:hypothetical protein
MPATLVALADEVIETQEPQSRLLWPSRPQAFVGSWGGCYQALGNGGNLLLILLMHRGAQSL